MAVLEIAERIKEGYRIKREDEDIVGQLKASDVDELLIASDMLRKHFKGDFVDLCSIIAGKSGNCGENCKFCAQSSFNHTQCDVYKLLDYETIYNEAHSNEIEGVKRFAIVNSGKGPTDSEFEKLIKIYERLGKELGISLCASLGFLTQEQFDRLYSVGVRRYHNNIETSRGYFPKICTTHSFDDKLANIERAKKAGLEVCSGGIIGMGETMDDRIDMAFDLMELEIKSIPINALIPIKGTPLENVSRLTEEEILRTVAFFRFINPEADIRLAAGRSLIKNDGERAFIGGASATITGNMLTTSGSTIKSDVEMFKRLGRII
ncbi:MAG: biotin synthase BioB [Eubacterium sp.]|nr:biotin synthase BioB [Eubacterium sp.]